jgi:segregation and condensation protein B
MPSAAKKLSIVHNGEPEQTPEQESLQQTSPEAVEAAADETVEVTLEEGTVEVTLQEGSQESEQRPEALRLLEAMLFAAADPLDEATLKRALPDGVDVKFSLGLLQAEYATRGVNLVRVGKKWTFRTAGDLSWLLTKQTIETRKLSRAAIETLAIVAYHQPVTRAEIEEIRGVQTATGTLDVLLKTAWIRPRGRRKAPGRPITYGTSEDFLSHFGLEEVGDLPGLDELKGAGLLEGSMPDGFGVPMPSDDASLRDDEEPLEPGDLELDLGLAPPEGQAEQGEKAQAAEEPEQGGEPEK